LDADGLEGTAIWAKLGMTKASEGLSGDLQASGDSSNPDMN